MVELNVGGVVFETSRAILTQSKDSYLSGLISGRYELERDRNGRVFIDRDAELFRTILNFLRDTKQPVKPRDEIESDLLSLEATYYGIKFHQYPLGRLVGACIYFFLAFTIGGHDGTEFLKSVELLDVARKCWNKCPGMEYRECRNRVKMCLLSAIFSGCRVYSQQNIRCRRSKFGLQSSLCG